MKLITAFGNPGEKYQNHRSNIGFKILDVIASNAGIEIKTKKKKSLIGEGEFEGEDIVLLKPQTYVEICGEAVLYIASFLRVKVSDIIVIHDDSALTLGSTRITRGNLIKNPHPGVVSVSQYLRSNQFYCIQVGIASRQQRNSRRLLDEDFTPEESTQIIDVINDTEAALRAISLGHVQDIVENHAQ